MTGRDVVVVPSTPALLPENAGLLDPVAELRDACREAVAWLAGRHPEELVVVAAGPRADNVARGVRDSTGERVARHLLSEAGFGGIVRTLSDAPGGGLLVVANGSASRSEKAPGHLHAGAAGFDAHVGAALRAGDPAVLRELDPAVAEELWCFDVAALQALGRVAAPPVSSTVLYEGDPYGVQYWVVRWTCGS